MQSYKYKRYSWLGGNLVGEFEMTMTSDKLYENTSAVGELAFLRLLNAWNAQKSTNGQNDVGIVHKYVMVVE